MNFFKEKEQFLGVHSIFTSINGEVCAAGQGSFTNFVRLAGCNLRCSYCDTLFAQLPEQGTMIPVGDIVEQLDKSQSNLVTITGGEPLQQQVPLESLYQKLHKKGFDISIETNGSRFPPKWKVSWVVDYKLPSSGMNYLMAPIETLWSSLTKKDFIKMVVCNLNDLIMGLQLIDTATTSATFAISPVMGAEGAIAVKDIIKEVHNSGVINKHNVILNCQLHKLLNLQEPQ